MLEGMNNQMLLSDQLKQLFLPTFVRRHVEVATDCESEKRSYLEYLGLLAGEEIEHRYQARIAKLIKAAKLPRNKHLSDFEVERIPGLSKTLIQTLASGDFIERYENILIFGNPGTGKTHLSIALAGQWCLQGRRVYFTSAANLVQMLLIAKQELKLKQVIQKLDHFEVLLIDDISYIPFDRDGSDVLFQLLSERYEMRSVLITSNLPFANWTSIFKDEITATAVIDRLVHHSTILELNTSSYRMNQAKEESKSKVKLEK
ncbi:MAG: IS21-like element helper ATPase IstB [Pseudomonadota bacterium]